METDGIFFTVILLSQYTSGNSSEPHPSHLEFWGLLPLQLSVSGFKTTEEGPQWCHCSWNNENPHSGGRAAAVDWIYVT